MKAANTRLNIDLSHNEISDSASEVIEKFILFAANPPIEEINFSYNKFTRKTAWRLAVGNLVNLPQHSYLNFILYPVPIKSDIFSQYDIDFPRHRE